MYLDELYVENLKVLDTMRLSFAEPDGSPRMWTVIIGANGTEICDGA